MDLRKILILIQPKVSTSGDQLSSPWFVLSLRSGQVSLATLDLAVIPLGNYRAQRGSYHALGSYCFANACGLPSRGSWRHF